MIETKCRRGSEQFEKIADCMIKNHSNLEKNYDQIFMKGPALTKDFLDKMQCEIVPSRTYLFGYETNTRRFLLATGFLLLFFSSLVGAGIMMFTNSFQNSIFSMLVISNTSRGYDLWTNPTPRPKVEIYIFNYTNIVEYEAKFEEKLHVQEVGPYVYEEQLQRVNIVFNDDDTVSYQEKRTYRFLPELSKGGQSDRVIVPNVPLLAGAATVKQENFLKRVSFSGILTTFAQKPFIDIPVDKLITGYTDNFYEVSKAAMKLKQIPIFDKFGLLVWKSGVQPDVITMNTGAKDMNKFGQIEKINEKSQLNIWSTEKCNSFQGSDGVAYPPSTIREKRPINYYVPQMCRLLPAEFEKEINILDGKIPAYRYKTPNNIFDLPEENPSNQCFCDKSSGNCPLKGLFNVTSCAFGAPLFYSFPHFQKGDESLRNGVTGLRTDPVPIGSHWDIHPTMGFLMGASASIQANVQVKKSFGVSQLNMFEDDLMLPLAWFNARLTDEELTEDVVNLIYQATFTVKGMELGLKYGCILTSIVTLICIVLLFKQKSMKRSNSSRPLRQTSMEG